ncbi:MAG: exo-alpha-sialidase [Kiritimatiellaeota bacterium]|nr:exo-alpha-sialidase [Kiritimatiellota bacterium]
MKLGNCLLALALVGAVSASAALPVYQPKVTLNDIYFPHPGAQPELRYNHDVDIVKFKGKFFAAWNANENRGEDKPGQYNYLNVSDDFPHWSNPVRMFTAAAGAANPVESDNQWQPNFINWKDQALFCSWCDFVARRVYIAHSSDGIHWNNVEVPNAPESLKGKASGFPTNHGLLTKQGVMLFPCSIPFTDTQRALVGKTRYAGVLRSEDGGTTWSWSAPIEAVTWTQAGEKPAEFGGDTITLWEPMLFEQADGKIGLLIRNSTAQENPERAEKPHRMLLYATSSDAGQTWTKARTVEVDTVCSRNFATAGVGTPDGLLMVMNDNNVRVPERINHDRCFLALYFSPVCDPDLLLPGPVVQPQGGCAYYPNGFVEGGKLFVAYTYAGGIHSSVIAPLPDFSQPFLLPREGRAGLKLEDGIAHFGQRQSSLGLVLTEKLTKQPQLHLAFDVNVSKYNGGDWPLLTLGGKMRNGTTLRVIYSEEAKADVFQIAIGGNKWADLAPCKLKTWHHVELELMADGLSVSINGAKAQSFKRALLRKICFGGLYVAPPWPQGMSPNNDVQVKLDSIKVE